MIDLTKNIENRHLKLDNFYMNKFDLILTFNYLNAADADLTYKHTVHIVKKIKLNL